MQLSVIIVNFNVKCFLEQCLCSLMKAATNIDTEVFVVDNNSTDGSKDFFEGRFSNVQFIWSNENTGFGKANNQALQLAVGEYILFLNPDTILPEDCLEKCIAFFEHRNDTGALGIHMIDGSGSFLKESKRGFPSPFTSFCKLSGLTALFPKSKTFASYYLGQLDQDKNHEVDVLAGAFMMIKKNVLDQTGGFDERFFMFGEDVDLCYRIQKAGFKNIYFSESTIVHFKGESARKDSLNYARLFYGAMSLFVKKHYSGGMAGFYNMLIQLAIYTMTLFSVIGNWLKRFFTARNVSGEGKRCFIIANKKEFKFIQSILQKNNVRQEIIGRINPPKLKEEGAVGNLQDLPGLVTRENPKEIIFSINGFSAKEMISVIRHLPKGISFRFHFAGTFSIVGSQRKASPGDCIL